jgi:enamine deaminase RidA (YjgF/YER057c/UK114 family)
MGTYRRLNVASGRPLEKLAYFSRAVRAGDLVLQSGTTAMDREGNIRGEGDIARQVEAIMAIAEWSMGKAGGKLEDVVRSRIYVTDIRLADQAAHVLARYFQEVRPVSTLVQVNRLARPEQLIEIEFDAIDDAKQTAQCISSGRAIEEEYAYSRAVRMGDRVFISGTTALNPQGIVEGVDDMYRQTRQTLETIFWALEQAGGAPGDLVYTKTFLTDLTRTADYTRAWLDALGEVRPTSTLLGIPGLVRPEMLIEIEAEAIIGAAKSRRDIYTAQQREKPRGYARAVEVGDWVYVSGCTSISPAAEVQAVGDWATQSDLAHAAIRWALEQTGATMDDVIRRRTFTVDSARVNRPSGAGPAWFANSCPASLGCRIAGLARPELLVEVEVAALKDAHANIEWIGPDAVDPLDGGTV